VRFADPTVRGRSEGVLILSGGLTIHNLRDRVCFEEVNYKQFDNAVIQAAQVHGASGIIRFLILSSFPRDRLGPGLSIHSHCNPISYVHEGWSVVEWRGLP